MVRTLRRPRVAGTSSRHGAARAAAPATAPAAHLDDASSEPAGHTPHPSGAVGVPLAERGGAPRQAPATASLTELAAAAAGCTACPLYRDATQTVFGEGNKTSRVVLVGEQPGDAEDRAGRPFVGPAGRVLDQALADAGIDRGICYVTNAVKHFKWTPRGKRRIHKTPLQREVEACSQWLDAELAAIKPELVICLGATAARAFFGAGARIGELRGKILRAPALPNARAQSAPHAAPHALRLLVTVHPSAVLRAPPEERAAAHAALVDDLRVATRYLQQP
jgi:DNA polymerase